MENKKSPHSKNAGRKNINVNKGKKKYLVNMPEKLGLPAGKKYFFIETWSGYSLNFGHKLWIGMPKILIENNPHLYTLIDGGLSHE